LSAISGSPPPRGSAGRACRAVSRARSCGFAPPGGPGRLLSGRQASEEEREADGGAPQLRSLHPPRQRAEHRAVGSERLGAEGDPRPEQLARRLSGRGRVSPVESGGDGGEATAVTFFFFFFFSLLFSVLLFYFFLFFSSVFLFFLFFCLLCVFIFFFFFSCFFSGWFFFIFLFGFLFFSFFSFFFLFSFLFFFLFF